jgi:2-dehydro-3-deoxyphosphogluconate aldolase / (4S)-4-hydroxy-2-oxoglutarate aldolase
LSWTKEKSLGRIRELAVIPVVRVSSYEHAMCAVKGIMEGGIDSVEITLTVPHAFSIIRELTTKFGEQLLVGAGTVLDAESCRRSLQAGAEFIVSPAFGAEVVALARQHNKVCMPGALTPTEILTAWNAGADLVKIFPCHAVGGPSFVRALKGPFPHIELVITGGITIETAPQFLAAGASAVGVGESVISPAALANNDTATIAASARRFVEAIRPGRSKS